MSTVVLDWCGGTLAEALALIRDQGIQIEADSFRVQAQRLGGPDAIAEEWARLYGPFPNDTDLSTLALFAWKKLLPGTPCAETVFNDLFEIMLLEPTSEVLNAASWAWAEEAKRRTMAIAKLACDLRPASAGSWLEELAKRGEKWDLCVWVAKFARGLWVRGKPTWATEISRAWCPLLLETCRGRWFRERLGCLCMSGRRMVDCCGRMGRG